MSDGPKPPLPRPPPFPAQKPGEKRKVAPPPPPPRAFKAGLPRPPDTDSLPGFFKKDILPLVPVTPPKPKPSISNPAPAPQPKEKAPAGGTPVPIPAFTVESSGSKRLPAPAGGTQQTPDSSGSKRLPTPPAGTVQPKKPSREDITSILRRTGANPVATPIGKPSFNGEAPLLEPPAQKAAAPAAISQASAPEAERASEIPVSIEVDVGEFETPMPAPLPAAPLQESHSAAPTPSFGAIDSKAKAALELAFKIFPEKKGNPVELKGNKLFIGGRECGEISPAKNSGQTLTISLEKMGLSNAHIAMDDELLSRVGTLFNTITESFLVRALEANDYAAIVANSSGIRLFFHKHGSDSASSSFPLKQYVEEKK